MRKPSPILLSVTTVVVISLACVVPSIPVTAPTMDPNSIGTVIAQTMAAALTQTAGAAVPVALSSPTLTFTPEPTLSPTVTLSPTSLYTATPLIPIVSVSVDTNCRVGPGQAYDRVGALLVGEETEVYALNPTGKYWYVRNPDKEDEYCWLWAEYATVVGNVLPLPVYTPPPTPTPEPGFDVNFTDLQVCSGWWVDLQLTNTGSTPFKSVAITIKDTNTDVNLSLYADQFKSIDDCVGSTTQDALKAGATLTVSVPAFAYDPRGHMLRATVTLCSAPGQSGACVTETFKFSP